MQNKTKKIKFVVFVFFLALIFVCSSFLTSPLNVQNNEISKKEVSLKISNSSGVFNWTWMSGNKTDDERGTYGTKGVPNAANYPGGRNEMVSWTDLDGNLWLFGGFGYAEYGASGYLNDLWRYNISSNIWTWMSGNKTIEEYGIYGTKGIPNAANYPGSKREMVSWTDLDGNLWLFGGVGRAESGATGYLNDLWRYNISSNIWTWISGNNTIYVYGVYGTKGVPNAVNYPGSRREMVSWTDLDGNFWLFGGWGYAESGSLDLLNDLWRYNISSNIWTWISGNNTINVYGVYSTKGVPNAANYPGSKREMVSWTDLDGNFWLFGGWGYAESGATGYLNDLWRYNISSNIWTWMSGNNTVNVFGVYGTKGVPNAANYPGSKCEMVSWTDLDGNLWLFGGWGYAESGATGYLNDLWRYNISSNIWTWISGNNTIYVYGVYGTKGVPNAANYPGSRGLITSWIDLDGNLWLFGGGGYAESTIGYLNDLWRFELPFNLNPSPFVLSTDADPIEYDGSFTLNWEISLDANNYSIYISNDYITEINSDCTQIASGLEVLYHSVNDLPTGDYYYIVVACNTYGNRTSNCIHVFIGRIPTLFELTTDAGDPGENGTFYLNWTMSIYANNYSIYTSNTTITEFDDSLTLIVLGLINNSYLINTTRNGHCYYIVVAYNNYGNATSNSVGVLVDNLTFIPPGEEGDNDKNSEPNDLYKLSEEEIASIVVGSTITGSAGIATAGTLYYFYGSKRTTKLLQKTGKQKVKKLRKKNSEKANKKNLNKAEVSARPSKEILTELSYKQDLLDLFEEGKSIETIGQLLDKTLTVVSEDFLNTVDQVGFSDSYKKEFMKEMLSFAPKERALITEDVLKSTIFYPIPPPVKPEKNKKEAIEDLLVYEDYTLELIQEYLEKNRQFEANKIVPFLSSRFSKASIDINIIGIKRILKSLVERNILVEGSKMVREEILLNSNRKEIYECIQKNPGIHFNNLFKRVNLSSAVVRWHVNILINFGFVRKEVIQNHETYFDLEVDPEYSELLHVISRKKYLNIIEFLKVNDYGVSKTKIAKELGMHINTVDKYLDKLRDLELIKMEKISNQNLYFLNKELFKKVEDKIISEIDE